ncbi:MAG TPA: cupredoxin domain-containing protein [Anaeromyxobacteraceae bacterium]|nr:cupredoxin domain-containing protein [Anaeromyxobacteraceae bacterium]
MKTRILLFPAAAALALSGAPALAQQMGGGMNMNHGGMHASAPAANGGIAEGVVKNGVRVVEMEVTGEGFVPSRVKVKKGEKVRLLITRKTDRTCATEIVIKDYGINTPLPLGKRVTVELTPKASGEIKYACAMNMIGGILFVP